MQQKYCAYHTKRLLTRHETCWNVTKCHAFHAKWSYTQRWKGPKVTPFAELPIGTAMRPSRERLRTVANGCERLRTVADVNATFGEHSSTPTPPEWNGNPCYAFGKKVFLGRFPFTKYRLGWIIAIYCNSQTWKVSRFALGGRTWTPHILVIKH